MKVSTLTLINSELEKLGINYAFLRWNGTVKYPYFVGEYTENPENDESGEMDHTFIINGFTRDSWLSLERVKEKIADHFRDYTTINDGIGVAIYYSNSIPIPQDTDELKRIQITLQVKEWRNK